MEEGEQQALGFPHLGSWSVHSVGSPMKLGSRPMSYVHGGPYTQGPFPPPFMVTNFWAPAASGTELVTS